MSTTPEIPFRRGAVKPVECLSAGWELIKDQYWLFVGMVAVGLIIGQAVPLGILMGPTDVARDEDAWTLFGNVWSL